MMWQLAVAAWCVLSVLGVVRLACFAVQSDPNVAGAVATCVPPPTKLARRSPSNQQAPGISLDGERHRLMARNIGASREQS